MSEKELQRKANWVVKDSVFTRLFQDKTNVLALYQTLHPEETDVTVEEINQITLETILMTGIYNDLGFIVRNQLILLVEAQSSWTENMTIRLALYLVESYNEYLLRTNQRLYSRRKVDLPFPELYVIYTGNEDVPDCLTLSDVYWDGIESDFEVIVHVIKQQGANSDIINQYIRFCKIVTEQVKYLGCNEQAIMETIRICKQQDILREFLSNHEQEVITVMFSLFSQEEVTKQFGEEQREEGEAIITKLTQFLLDDNRMDDLRRSLQDPAFQQQLLREYNLSGS